MFYSPRRDKEAESVQRNCEEFYQGNEEAVKANLTDLMK